MRKVIMALAATVMLVACTPRNTKAVDTDAAADSTVVEVVDSTVVAVDSTVTE